MEKLRCDVSIAEHAYASFISNKAKNTAVKTAAMSSATISNSSSPTTSYCGY